MKYIEFKRNDVGYPVLLKQIHDTPKQLYVWGELPKARHWVAIVGSRKFTPYGREIASQLAQELAGQGVIIVSGLAYGVDASAHRGTLEGGGRTIAVLGGGMRKLYPPAHLGLAKQIVEQGGAVISEYDSDTPPLPHQFLERNRIIAGLCHVTIVVEAAIKSGSLTTATLALENGREVMAVPGNVNQPTSEGTNKLIKHGAHVVTSAQDVLDLLGIKREEKEVIVYKPASLEESLILKLLGEGIYEGYELLERSGLEPHIFSTHLTMLEINGAIRSGGANTWHLR